MEKEGNLSKAVQSNNNKNKKNLIAWMANNADIQPNIFQNPVLIFLNGTWNICSLLQRKKNQQGFDCK